MVDSSHIHANLYNQLREVVSVDDVKVVQTKGIETDGDGKTLTELTPALRALEIRVKSCRCERIFSVKLHVEDSNLRIRGGAEVKLIRINLSLDMVASLVNYPNTSVTSSHKHPCRAIVVGFEHGLLVGAGGELLVPGAEKFFGIEHFPVVLSCWDGSAAADSLGG